MKITQQIGVATVFIRHQRLENSLFITQNSLANIKFLVAYSMTIFYSDVEPLSKYSPVMIHLFSSYWNL